VKNDSDGNVTFTPIEFAEDDIGTEHTYTIVEKAGASNAYTYDEKIYTVKVTPKKGAITKAADGSLKGTITATPSVTSSAASGNVDDIVFGNSTNKLSITAKKIWDDNGDADRVRPDKLILTLYANGSKYEADGVTNPVTLTKADADTSDSTGSTWTYMWENLPMASNGKEITYSVGEETVSYYDESTATGAKTGTGGEYSQIVTLTNSHKLFTYVDGILDLTARKTLDGGTPGSEVFTFTLTADGQNPNGKDTVSQKKDCEADGTVKFDDITFTKDDVGKTFVFYVSEQAGTEAYEYDSTVYKVSVMPVLGKPSADWKRAIIVRPEIRKVSDVTESTADSISFANKTLTTDVSVLKVWKNEDDHTVFPQSVKVRLYQTPEGGKPTAYGEAAELTAAENWSYTWSGLPRMKDGLKVTYSVREVEAPEGFVMNNSGEAVETDDSTEENVKFVLENDWIKTRRAELKLNAEKNVDGREPSDNQVFSFVLEELEPDGTVNEIGVFQNHGKDILIEGIPEFAYDADDIGNTYRYLLREDGGSGMSEMKYDKTVYDIRVTVKGGETQTDTDGMPYRDVIIDKEIRFREPGKKFEEEDPAGMLSFNNETIPVLPDDGGSDGGVKTGDNTGITMYLMLLAGSTALLAVMSGYRRRKARR
jgi:hypothetical protein